MSNYVISCSSTADLSKEHFDAIDVKYLIYHYEIGGSEYPDDLGQTIPFEQFYQMMADGAETRTWQPSPEQYSEYFRPILEEGNDILHVTLSSGLSGAINSANLARQILEEDFPDRKIYIVDSLGASSGYGLIMDTLAAKRDEGMGIDELYEWVEANKLRMHYWFFSTDLTFYIKGGRVSKTAGFIGGMLNICPLLNMDYLGRLIPRLKIRGKKKVIREIVRKMEEHAQDGLEYSGKCYMSTSASYDDAREVADLVESLFPNLDGKVELNSIGTTIGSHTGPGTVALFFWGDERVD